MEKDASKAPFPAIEGRRSRLHSGCRARNRGFILQMGYVDLNPLERGYSKEAGRLRLRGRYRTTLENFTERAVEELGARVESIVLYGSVARGENRADSDIDVLIVGRDKEAWKNVVQISFEVDYENRFETFITPIYYTMEELEHGVKVGSPFIYEVLKEGVALYDDGTFKRIREKVLGAGGRIPSRR